MEGGREGERKGGGRERLHLLVTPQMSTANRVALGCSQDPETSSRYFICVAGTQILGPSSTAFPGVFAGNLIRSME